MQIALTFRNSLSNIKRRVLHTRASAMCYITRRFPKVGFSRYVNIHRLLTEPFFVLADKKMRKYAFESIFSTYLCEANRPKSHCHSMTVFLVCTTVFAQTRLLNETGAKTSKQHSNPTFHCNYFIEPTCNK